MHVHLIAVPYDSGRRGERMGAGPEHLLEAGLGSRLRDAGHEAQVRMVDPPPDSWAAEIGTAFALARGVAAEVRGAAEAGAFPLVLSGNCAPAALGSVSGLGGSPPVFWFDAHADFNTPDTTIGGFLDGMALATVTGRCWRQLARGIPGFAPAGEESVVLLGSRDLDPLEADALEGSSVRRLLPAELRPRLPETLGGMDLAGRQAYLHLDLDVLDPAEGRVNVYAAAGGLTRAEAAWAIETIAAASPLGAASLTALDPACDPGGGAVDAALALAVTLVDAAARR